MARAARGSESRATAAAEEIVAPAAAGTPSTARPRPQPAMLPTLNTRPPKATSTATATPRPGTSSEASSWPRRRATPSTRQTLTWAATSTAIEARIAKAKSARSALVNTAVWVRKPGPMAEVAMSSAAPAVAVAPASGRDTRGGGPAGPCTARV
jgi:hypothetical protein